MVKKLIFISIFFSCCFTYSQDNNLWFYRTPENFFYENRFEIIFSDIKDGILKEEIKKYIKLHIGHSDKKEVAVMVVLLSNNVNEIKYRISYSTDYYDYITTGKEIDIQSISKIDDKIVFLISRFNNDVVVNKNFLFGLLRARFPDVTKELNELYKEELKDGEGGIPSITVLEHQIPFWFITIKDNKLLNKEIEIDY